MTDTFTRAERDAINLAFAAIEYECDRAPHEYAIQLRDALRIETQGRGRAYAKALICGAFAEGMLNGDSEAAHKPAYLFGLSPGIRIAHCMGAAFRARLTDAVCQGFMTALAPAKAAMSADLGRR